MRPSPEELRQLAPLGGRARWGKQLPYHRRKPVSRRPALEHCPRFTIRELKDELIQNYAVAQLGPWMPQFKTATQYTAALQRLVEALKKKCFDWPPYAILPEGQRVNLYVCSIGFKKAGRSLSFQCPHCGRRVWNLYRPPYQAGWACKKCHGLQDTYSRSCRRLRIARRIAKARGVSVGSILHEIPAPPSKPSFKLFQ